jgi:hypothetical protein
MDGAFVTDRGDERCIQDNLREKDLFEDQGIAERKLALKNRIGGGGGAWTGLIWLRIGTNCGLF